jgi:hypothetical protein
MGVRRGLLLAMTLACLARAQSWTTIATPPESLTLCLLLTDGGVMCQGTSYSAWYKLTPDPTSGYLGGSWSSLAALPSGYTPDAFASAVLADGRVAIVGGEYNAGQFALTNLGAIYDPAANTWTPLAPPSAGSPDRFECIGDAPATVLADGRLIVGSKLYQDLAVLDPATLSWSVVSATGKTDGINSEEGWTLLPDGSFFTLDVRNAPSSERFLLTGSTTGVWASSGSTPQDLHTPTTSQPITAPGCPVYNPPGEVGPSLLRPDGTVFAVGADGFTGVYTPPPPLSTAAGTWAAGPQLPAGLNVQDGPGAVLPSGHVLFGASPGASGPGLQYFEFDGARLIGVPAPANASGYATYFTSLLVLPTGQVMLTDFSTTVQIYTPAASPTYNASWAPAIGAVPSTISSGATYRITGTQFNGLGQGSAFGDEAQNATNYPLVRITNLASGHALYAKTHGHSSMGVATGAASVFTYFDVPANIETGPSTVQVVANGIPSAPAAVTVIHLAAQTISFGALPNQTLGTAPFTVSATASSGLAVSFASTTAPVCTLSGATVTLIAVGTCTVEATQGGDSNYAAATPAGRSFQVTSGLPAAPALVSPANGSAGALLTSTLAWNAASGAISYQVFFGTMSTPPLVTTTSGSSYTAMALTANTTYYWQIVAENGFGSAGSAIWSFTTGTAVAPLRFVPVPPCRVADTRYPGGVFGSPTLTANSSRSFPIPASGCGIPATAQAYSLNVTVVPAGLLSFLTLWPAGQPQPVVSTLNSFAGIVVANAAIVPAGTSGAVSVYVSDQSDVILDIDGYFDATSSATSYSFYPATPCRVADTRGTVGEFGGPSMGIDQTRDFPIPLGSCGIPGTAKAYSLNVTAIPSEALAFLTAFPTGPARPLVSTLNSFTGKVVANAALVPAGTNGSISVYVTGQTDVVLDTNGYFGQPGGAGELRFYPLTPCRVVDTRGTAGPFGGPEMEAQSTRSFAIPAGGCNVPSTAKAYSMNVTVVPDGVLSFLTAWPAGAGQPFVSTLNSFDGSVVANAAIVPAGANGAISIYVTDRTHVILDINGYFAP